MGINDIFLKDLSVDNYKSLKDSSIELQMGLNIIIGKNGAGKSNLLDFINRYTGRNFFNVPLRSNLSNFSMSVAYSTEEIINILSYRLEKIRRDDKINGKDSPYRYEFVINKQENNRTVIENTKMEFIEIFYPALIEGDHRIPLELDILETLDVSYIPFALPEMAYWLSRPNRFIIDNVSAIPGSEDPYPFSYPYFFQKLDNRVWSSSALAEKRKDITLLKEYLFILFADYLEASDINSILKNFTPITEIRVSPNLNIYVTEEATIVENLSVEFLIDGNWMPWSYLSDGTKRLFYLIADCLSLEQGIILLEEPELGVHPSQLFKVMDFLREQSRTKQIIISTHSPLVLDVLKEDELDRIIVAKYEKGTRFSHLSVEEISKAKKYMNEVGELSYYWLHSDLEK